MAQKGSIVLKKNSVQALAVPAPTKIPTSQGLPSTARVPRLTGALPGSQDRLAKSPVARGGKKKPEKP